MSTPQLERRIGIGGAVFMLVGYVVGASIFILPGQLAASAGPGVVISYLLAAVPALFTCVISAHVGSCFPTSGAAYVATSRVLGPFWGFMLVWTTLLAAAIGIAFVAYGFADYVRYFLPAMPHLGTAVAVVLLLGVVNLVGVQLAVRMQAAMVVWFMVTLLVFGIGGLAKADGALLRPLMPNGFGPVVGAAIAAYFSFTGLAVISEIGEEIKDPKRTIPLCLFISFSVILLMYTLVPLALTGLIPWQELGGVSAPVATAAERFLPKGVAAVISLSALAAAATSINGILLAQARDVFALARDRIFPMRLGHISPRSGVPDGAILFLVVVSLLCILGGATITQYAIMSVQGVMLLQMLASIAVLRLPRALPERYADAAFQLSPFWHIFFCVGLFLTSAFFFVVGALESRRSTGLFLVFVALGALYYVWRRRALARQGVPIADALHL